MCVTVAGAHHPLTEFDGMSLKRVRLKLEQPMVVHRSSGGSTVDIPTRFSEAYFTIISPQ
jgi:hypothetical protein